jgi:hypothetical protein
MLVNHRVDIRGPRLRAALYGHNGSCNGDTIVVRTFSSTPCRYRRRRSSRTFRLGAMQPGTKNVIQIIRLMNGIR